MGHQAAIQDTRKGPSEEAEKKVDCSKLHKRTLWREKAKVLFMPKTGNIETEALVDFGGICNI